MIESLSFKEAFAMPLLSPDEENELALRLKNHDEEARKMLIERNLRLTVFVAQKFINTGIALGELASVGSIGLVKAVDTFNTGRKVKLASYASRCIENEILMFLRKASRWRREVSLEAPIKTNREGAELLLCDVLGADPETVTDGMEREDERNDVRRALGGLTDREWQIVVLRYGLGGRQEHSQKETAELLGVSQTQISRLEKRILLHMREELERAR